MHSPDTIFAPATAMGRSGVAVIRLSGPRAGAALGALGVSPLPAPRLARLAAFRHPETGEVIDHGLALYFPAPHSFTGEEVVELHLHGSRAVLHEMLDVLSALPGLRLAGPGEFSRRAFLSGKFDLTAAEGLIDLIDAETGAQKRQALGLMEGHAGRAYAGMRERAIRALALFEAYLDFPDEEIPEATLRRVAEEIQMLRRDIALQLDDGGRGEKIRDGLTVVILGAPNAGKSTLLNYLAKRDVAIVSAEPGTTRDALMVELDLGGYKVTLVDTAGLRESADPVEREGVARARAHAKRADLKLALFDASALPALDAETLKLADERSLLCASRWDLAGVEARQRSAMAESVISTGVARGAWCVAGFTGADAFFQDSASKAMAPVPCHAPQLAPEAEVSFQEPFSKDAPHFIAGSASSSHAPVATEASRTTHHAPRFAAGAIPSSHDPLSMQAAGDACRPPRFTAGADSASQDPVSADASPVTRQAPRFRTGSASSSPHPISANAATRHAPPAVHSFLIPLSTVTGEGCDALLAALRERVAGFFTGEAPLITHARHRAALAAAERHLAAALRDGPLELRCEDLRRAATEIGKITGKIDLDAVLDVVFREFCIGK